jgi:hypothetical protein
MTGSSSAVLIEDSDKPARKAGNDLRVRWFVRDSNPQRGWNSGIIGPEEPMEDRWLDVLIVIDTLEALGRMQAGSVED